MSIFKDIMSKKWHWDNFVNESKDLKMAFESIDHSAEDCAIEIINGNKPELMNYVNSIIKDSENKESYFYGSVDRLTSKEILDIFEVAILASIHSLTWRTR